MSFFILSCSFRRANEIAISTDFTIKQQDIIVYAIDQWFDACPDLEVDVYISDDPTVFPISCTEDSKKGYTNLQTFKRPTAYLCNDVDVVDYDEFQVITMHELGHYLTVKKSHTSPISIMQKDIDDKNAVINKLTSKDIKWACE